MWLGFVLGLFFGVGLGIFTVGLLQMASKPHSELRYDYREAHEDS